MADFNADYKAWVALQAKLRDDAWGELQQVDRAWSKVAGYSPDRLAKTHWGKGKALLDMIGKNNPIPPATVPAVPPSSSGQAELGIIPNAGFPGSYGSIAAALNPQWIREDHLSASLVSWGATNNVGVMGLGGPLTMATVATYPTIDLWEYDNEPYFRAVTFPAYATTMRNFAVTFKAAYPTKKLIMPTLVQVNGGDYNGAQGWRPWVSYVFDAAPDIGQYFDGWGAHPYSIGLAPSFTVLDKVHDQLVARGFGKPCYVTEVGWSVGVGGNQVSEANQSTYIGSFIDSARTRSWIEQIYIYCLRTWDTSYEGSFGMYASNNVTERASAATFRSKIL